MPDRLLIHMGNEAFTLIRVNPKWNADTLLSGDGVFFLEDLCNKLPIRPDHIRRDAQALETIGQCPWQTMGAKRIFGHWLWLVQMAVFAVYYRTRFAR